LSQQKRGKEVPLSKEHKRETRRRIVESARRLFKTEGYDGVTIDAIMADADLTRGGFYAHFSSKDDLFNEVVGEIVFAAILRKHEETGSKEPASWRQQTVDFYLSKEHRDSASGGCPMAGLSNDVAKSNETIRTTYTEIVADLADALADRIDLKGREKRKAALATVATCVGAMAIARAVSDEDLVDELFEAGRWATRRMASSHSSRRS